MVERVLRRIPDKPVTRIWHELPGLAERWSVLAQILHLAKVKLLMLELRQIIHPARVFRRNVVDLREILFLDDWEVDMAHHTCRVDVQVLARSVVHDTLVQLRRLSVLVDLAFVVVMAFAADDGIGYFIRSLGNIWTETAWSTS